MTYTKCKICGNGILPLIASKKLFECVDCKAVFYIESLDDHETAELYSSLYHDGTDPSYMAHIQSQELIIQNIQPRLGYNKSQVLKCILRAKVSNVCEIGAGVGVVGKYISDKGMNYTGIEFEESIANIAKSAGINILPGSYKNLKGYPFVFDALLAFEVIEHIDELGLCLQLIHQALKDKGLFGFTVPNLNKRRNYKGNSDQLYQPNPPLHVNFFTVQNIPLILGLFGFKAIFLKKRAFPDLNLRKKQTYLLLLKAIVGKYEGSTIMCVAQKQ